MAPKRKNIEKPSNSVTKNVEIRRVTFKVTKREGSEGYKAFLSTMRNEITQSCSKRYGIPVLPVEKKPTKPDDFIESCLQTEDNEIVLLIQRDNMYLVGFKERNAPKYYEFKSDKILTQEKKPDKTHTINPKVTPDFIPSSPLGFTGNYVQIAPDRIRNLSFNQFTMRDAVNFLAKYRSRDDAKAKVARGKHVGGEVIDTKNDDGTKGDKEAKRFLACLIVAICEALRFETVEEFIFEQMKHVEYKKLGADLDEEIHKWKYHSTLILDPSQPPLSEEEIQMYQKKLKVLKPSSRS